VALQPSTSITPTTRHGTSCKVNLPFATPTVGAGTTVFVPAGVAHTYTAASDARYLIVLTPRLSALIKTLQSDRDSAHQSDIYKRFNSELLE